MNKNNTLPLYKNNLVIHLKYGIGKYQGLSIIKNNNIKSEYITILYANNAKLYVPIQHLYLIKKYKTVLNEEKIHLHKLGNTKWNKERKKIFKDIHDIALKILDNHAYRISKPGFSFKNNIKKYNLFCKKISFQMTKDQNTVMDSILTDMSKPIAMNRLVCGDVGFGKTEIAIRAAFVAVNNKKQVLVLVPTTLLAQQHYKVFYDRFLEWNINVSILSRFQSKLQQENCIKDIENGKINILISTHKILFSNLKWFNLGLLIIDEEHRFGVDQKEKIKKIFLNIDILILTATPIPRTLNMAMQGIYDLSIISTPPKNRLTIKTYIKEYDEQLIRKIIIKEIKNNRQIYYIYNKVKYLENKLLLLKKIIPEAKFKISHGQMPGKVLKKIIHDFSNQKFNVLICTTIIETGLNIPTVNSIIIEDAHLFGLAQLHQMRGRVGRSNIQSYAWLLIPKNKKISITGKKKLKAINNIKKLGSGLELSQHDLKIRGMGELLGRHQSGHIKNIQFDLYMKLLKKAVQLIKNKSTLSLNEIEKNQPEIKLSVPTLFPIKYIPNVNQRLYLYKKIFSLNSIKKLSKIKLHLIKNFGKLPIESKNLILTIRIKILLNFIGIISIHSDQKGGMIKFSKKNNFIDVNKLLTIFKNEFTKWKIISQYTLQYSYYISDDSKRIKWIISLLKKIKNTIDLKKSLK